MKSTTISFVLDGRLMRLDFSDSCPWTPTTTVLQFLRSLPDHRGVKEGCAEGDCGACTVVVGELDADGTWHYSAVDSCLLFLPMIHGKYLITVENVADGPVLHPVQEALASHHGAQCGFCTPGIVMALMALYKNHDHPSRPIIEDALTGNLCRCTGYRPIVEAAAHACVHGRRDHFSNGEAGIAELICSIPRASLAIRSGQQSYYQPIDLGEALILKAEHPTAVVVGGATDVALRVTKRHESLEEVLDVSRVPQLGEFEENDSAVLLGAGLTLNRVRTIVETSLPALFDMLSLFGSPQIRNVATLGGNVGTASPIGDTLPVLMAYGAKVIVESVHGRRKIDIDQWITGYRRTARREDELVTSIKIRRPEGGVAVKSYKVSKRKDLDISTVSAGFRVERDASDTVTHVVLAYGGMADTVRRAKATEEFLIGKPWTRPTIEQAMIVVASEFSPIADARSGAEFRRLAARNLLMKFWHETQRPTASGPIP